MERNKLSFFQRIERSLSDFSFYKVIVQESTGKAIFYLILLSLILGILSSIKPFYQISKSMKDFEKNIPEIKIENGELKVDAKMPIILKDNDSVLIIDTRKEANKYMLDSYSQGTLVTSKQILVKYGLSNIEELYSFSNSKDAILNKSKVKNSLTIIKFILIPFYTLGVTLITILGKLISSLFISLIALVINAVFNANLRYKALYKIGIYAMTLPSIIKFIMQQLSFYIPLFNFLFFFIYYGIVIFYMVKAIIEIKKESQLNFPQNT